jgi:hypothetical protein
MHRLSYRHAAQKVYAEGPLYCIETATRRQAVTLPDNAGVIDQDVEMAEAGIDVLRGGGDGSGIVKVDGEISDIATFTLERSCRLFPECSIARAQQDCAT